MKYARKIFITCGFSVLFGSAVHAQDIHGVVFDADHHPLEFANMAIYGDSGKFVKGTISDEKGMFQILLPPQKNSYRLITSYAGMKSDTLQISGGGAVGNITIELSYDSRMINEVKVVATRQIFRERGDVITADVEHSILSKSGTLDRLMNQIPFVSGSEGTYNVFGRGQAELYINGRKVYDTDELKLLTSDKVKSIEVITNPGTRYSSEVKSVIKIYTKDNQDGLGGNMTTYLQYGRKFSNFENVSLVYNHRKLQFLGSLSYNRIKMKEYAQDYSEILKDVPSVNGDDVAINYTGTAPRANFGFNYNYTKKSFLGLNTSLSLNKLYNDIDLKSIYHRTGDVTDFNSNAYGRSGNKPLQWISNAYWDTNIGKTGIEVTNDFLLGRRRNTFAYYEETSASVNTNNVMHYLMNSTIVNANTPIVQGLSLNYGAELTFSRDRQNFGFDEEHITTGLADTGNEQRQFLNAEYINLDMGKGKWNVSAGLRYEYTKENYYEGGKKSDAQSRKYNDFFPNVNIGYTPIPMMNFSLGYRRTIKRPAYAVLNDNIQYNSRYAYIQGNSMLKPEYTNSINMLASYRNLHLIASYEKVEKTIMSAKSVYGTSKDIILSKTENMPDFEKLSVGINWWDHFGFYTPYLEFNIGKQNFSYVYMGKDNKYDTPLYNFKIHSTFALPENYNIMVFLDYYGKNYDLFREHTKRWGSQLSISKSFAKGWSAQLSCNNLFCSGKYSSITYCDWIKDATQNDRDYQNVSLLVAYHFNNKSVKHNVQTKTSEIRRY